MNRRILCLAFLLPAHLPCCAGGPDAPESGTGPAGAAGCVPAEPPPAVPWTTGPVDGTLESRIPVPDGYERVALEEGGFGSWLRSLPVRPGRPPVRLHDGRPKGNQEAHHLVLAVDVGERDLQQCADAVIRLRAEYLFRRGCVDGLVFDFTSGDAASWAEWSAGGRPRIRGDDVEWRRSAEPDDGYQAFRDYLDTVFTYAGSASLARELEDVTEPAFPEAGDVFVQGGFPGHAVIVVDVAADEAGRRIFLLAQSYMPAQEIHVLRNPAGSPGPWYRARTRGVLRTPEWDFRYGDLKRFSVARCD